MTDSDGGSGGHSSDGDSDNRESGDPVVSRADLDWREYDHGDRTFHRKQLSREAEGADIGASLYDVPPGKRTWLRHYHTGNEEALYVLEGSGTLLLGPGSEEHALQPGDYAAFPTGEEGTHEIVAGEDGLQFLMVSTMNEPDITVYPDEDMVGLYAGAAPGGDSSRRSLSRYLDADAEVGYWDD